MNVVSEMFVIYEAGPQLEYAQQRWEQDLNKTYHEYYEQYRQSPNLTENEARAKAIRNAYLKQTGLITVSRMLCHLHGGRCEYRLLCVFITTQSDTLPTNNLAVMTTIGELFLLLFVHRLYQSSLNLMVYSYRKDMAMLPRYSRRQGSSFQCRIH